MTCRDTCIFPIHTILIVVPREGSRVSGHLTQRQTIRHTARELADLEVIDSTTRSSTAAGIIAPNDNYFVVTHLLYIKFDTLGLPCGAEVQLRTTVQSNPSFRQRGSTQSGRKLFSSFYFYRSRYQSYTHIIPRGLTITQPVEGEGIHSSFFEVEGLGSIYDTCDIIGISSRNAIIIRYIERVRTAISYSRTAYPLVDKRTIERQPSVPLFKVPIVRQLSRSLEGLEGLHQRLTLLGLATSAANEEDIIGRLSQSAQINELIAGRTGIIGLSRSEVSRRISYVAVLPLTFPVCVPRDRSRRTGDTTDRNTERTLTSRDQINSHIGDVEVIVTVSFGGLTVERQ